MTGTRFGEDYGITCGQCKQKKNFVEVRRLSQGSHIIYSERTCKNCGYRWNLEIPSDDPEKDIMTKGGKAFIKLSKKNATKAEIEALMKILKESGLKFKVIEY
jgi:rubredoxin